MLENNELIAVKANKFIQEYKISLSLAEIRIVNYLIANIDSPKYDKEFREFRFEIKEFADIVYPNKEKTEVYRWLPKVIKELSDKSAWKEVPSTENVGKTKKVLIRWIEEPEFEVGFVKLKLNKYLAPYLLQLDKGFLKSKFQYTALAQSKYTIPLYELLKSWESVKNHKKIFEIEELKLYMDATKQSQKNVAEFKRTALDPAVNEINELTDLQISYAETKRGRKTTHIEFTILSKQPSENNHLEGQEAFSDNQTFDAYVNDYKSESGGASAEQISDNQSKDIDKIVEMMEQHKITALEAKKIYDSAKGDMYHIATIYEYAQTQNVKNIVAYMIRMVSPNVFKEPKKSSKKTAFHNNMERPREEYLDAIKQLEEMQYREIEERMNQGE